MKKLILSLSFLLIFVVSNIFCQVPLVWEDYFPVHTSTVPSYHLQRGNTPVILSTTDEGIISAIPVVTNDQLDSKVLKYDGQDGSILWDYNFEVSSNYEDEINDIKIDNQGNIIIVGTSIDSASIFGEYYGSIVSIVKISDEGDLLWDFTIGNEEFQFVKGIAIELDSMDNIYVSYDVSNNFIDSEYSRVLKLDDNGATIWEEELEGVSNRLIKYTDEGHIKIVSRVTITSFGVYTFNDQGVLLSNYEIDSVKTWNDPVIDNHGNVYVKHTTGRYRLDKFNEIGNREWTFEEESQLLQYGIHVDESISIHVSEDENVLITGRYSEGDISNGTLERNQYILTYSLLPNGDISWVSRFGNLDNNSIDIGLNISVNSSNEILVSGYSIINSYPSTSALQVLYDSTGNVLWTRNTDRHEYEDVFTHSIWNDESLYTMGWHRDADSIMNFNLSKYASLVSVSDVNSIAEKVTIYPNPSKGRIYFEENIDIDKFNDEVEIQIVNLDGGIVYVNRNLRENYIDVNHLSAGIYFVNIIVLNKKYSNKIIINN